MTLGAIIADVTTTVTASVSWMQTFIQFMVDNPLVLIGAVILPLVGFGAGLLGRIFNLRA